MTSATLTAGLGSTNTQNIDNSVTNYASPDALRSPSIIAKLIHILSEEPLGGPVTIDDYRTFEIADKLEHNKVQVYLELINQYFEYVVIVDSAYDIIVEEKPLGRDKVLKNINNVYLTKVGELCAENEIASPDTEERLALIRANSDSIIKHVIEHVKQVCLRSAGIETLDIEDIEIHSQYIVFHAFVECKVLEKPT